MVDDALGLPIGAASHAAAKALDDVVLGYLGYRADIPQRMAALLELDPEFGLAHCLKGYFAMLAYKRAAAAGCRGCRGRRGTPHHERHAARTRACHRAQALDRWRRRTAPSLSGNRSWATIRATSWPSAWRISSISGSAART